MGDGSAIGRVRGLGSGHQGSEGWWHHKISAGSNLVLVLWFLLSIALLPAHDYATLSGWVSQTVVAVPLILLVVSTFYHFHHGLTVVIEDYQHDETRFVLLIVLKYFTIATATLAIFSILKVAFTAGAAL